MKSYLKYILIGILVVGIGLGGFFALRPIFKTSDNPTPPVIELPSDIDKDEVDNNDTDDSTNDNTETNDGNNDTSGDNSNNDGSSNDDDSSDDGNDDNSDSGNNGDQSDGNDDTNDDGNDSGTDDNDGTTDPDDIDKKYEIKIYENSTLVYSSNYTGNIYSNINNGEYVCYTLVIESNYEISLSFSANISILNSITQDFNITKTFNILNGDSFDIFVDNTKYSINCLEYKQYSHFVELAKGQAGVSLEDNKIYLTDTNTVMFQVILFEDSKQVPFELICNNLVLNYLYGAYYVELNSSITANFLIPEYNYSFTLEFIII